MGSLLTTGSFLAAFFAGSVALFSPCCIVFLFPAYLAAAVKNRRWRLLPLTFVFALGLAVVLLPITLGVGMISNAVVRYHTQLYLIGGLLLIALALLALSGRTWSMPSFIRSPSVERSDTAGVFALGVFSGIASSCCAPVLAGIVVLSAISPSLVGSAGLGLAYVFGMVFPLFLMGLLWDRLHLGERRILQAKPVRLRIFGRTIDTNTINVAVAIAFAVMGAFVLFLAASGNTTPTPPFVLAIGRSLSGAFTRVVTFLDPVPQPIIGLVLLGLATAFVVLGFRGRRGPVEGSTEGSIEGGSCHDHHAQDRVEADEKAGDEADLALSETAAPHGQG